MQWQDENSKNHNKTGGAINLIDDTKTTPAFYANKEEVDKKWNLTSEEQKEFEKFEYALHAVVDPWYDGVTDYGRKAADYH